MENLSKYHLNSLRAVEALARHGTLSGAANELFVSPGAISKHVIAFERQAGKKLFYRTAAGFKAIESSQEFLLELARGFQSLSNSINQLNRVDKKEIRISAAPCFARNWLIPRLNIFYAQHPNITIDLNASRELIDLYGGGFDCAIRFGHGNWRGTEKFKLLEQLLFPVCSPQLVSPPKSLEGLRKVNIITSESIGMNWKLWLTSNGVTDLNFPRKLSFSDEDMCFTAAINGLGVSLSWQIQAMDALRSGQLVIPLSKSAPTGFSYWFLTPSGTKPSTSVTLFREWLIGEIEICLGLFDIIPIPIN